MKKVALMMMVLVMATLTVPVRAETAGDVIPQIIEVIATKIPTAADWDDAVNWSQQHQRDWQSDDVKSIDQIADLIKMLEESRKDAITNHHNIMGEGGGLGIGIWEKDAERMELVKEAFKVILETFKAKTGVQVLVEIERTNPEHGYVLWRFYTKEEPYFKTHPATTLGQAAYAQWNTDDGHYYESAWGGGSGKHGYVGNAYVSDNQPVFVMAVAYLNDKNEVIEVIDEPGAAIDTNRKRMLLIKTEATLLGWIAPENVVT